MQIFSQSAGQATNTISYSYRVPEDYYGKSAYLLISYVYSNEAATSHKLNVALTGYEITNTIANQSVVRTDGGQPFGKTIIYEGTLRGGTIDVSLNGWDRDLLTVMLVVK